MIGRYLSIRFDLNMRLFFTLVDTVDYICDNKYVKNKI